MSIYNYNNKTIKENMKQQMMHRAREEYMKLEKQKIIEMVLKAEEEQKSEKFI